MDAEEKQLWRQEIQWRDQEIVRLEDQLFKLYQLIEGIQNA